MCFALCLSLFPPSDFRFLDTLFLELRLFRRILERFHRTFALGDAIHHAVKVTGSDKFLMGNGHVAILFAVGKLLLLKF